MIQEVMRISSDLSGKNLTRTKYGHCPPPREPKPLYLSLAPWGRAVLGLR